MTSIFSNPSNDGDHSHDCLKMESGHMVLLRFLYIDFNLSTLSVTSFNLFVFFKKIDFTDF